MCPPSNYPDGVQEQDIPGNRPEDERMQSVCDIVEEMDDGDVLNELSDRFPKAWNRVVDTARDELVDCIIEEQNSSRW